MLHQVGVSFDLHGVQLRELVSDVDKPRDLIDIHEDRPLSVAKDLIKIASDAFDIRFHNHPCTTVLSAQVIIKKTFIYSTPLQSGMPRIRFSMM